MTSPLLALRPANAVRQLGPGSQVPLLGLRQVLPVLQSARQPLWIPVVRDRPEAEAVLRAAARLQAVAGLCLWPGDCPAMELRFRHSPEAFFQAVRASATAVEGCGPFVLHVQLPPFEMGEQTVLAAFSAACVEAGFTSLGASLTGEPDPQRIEALLGVLAPAREYELGTMLLVEPAAAASAWLERLSAAGFAPEVLLGERTRPEAAGETVCGWAARDLCPPAELRAEVVLGPLERGSSPEISEALAYSEMLRYVEAFSLRGSAARLERVFSSK